MTIRRRLRGRSARTRRGQDERRGPRTSSRRVASPGAGACGGQFTANTMAMAFEVLGISPMAQRLVPAAGRRPRPRSPTRPASWSVDVLKRGAAAAATSSREASLENAIAARGLLAAARPTRVLHLLAVAREIGVELDIDDFDRDQRAHAAAVRPQARRAVRRRRPLQGRRRAGHRSSACRRPGCSTRTRSRSPARRSASSPTRPTETEGQRVVRPLDEPLKATGGLAILRGNLAPEGCVVKLAGHERRHHSGPARVFDGEEAAMAAVTTRRHPGRRRRRHPQRGPRRRARACARCSAVTGGDQRRGPGRGRRAAHRRALLRRHARLHGRPRRARGGARRPDRRGPGRRRRSRSTSTRGAWTSRSTTTRSRAASRPTRRRANADRDRRAGQVRRARGQRLRGRRHPAPERRRGARPRRPRPARRRARPAPRPGTPRAAR